MDLAEALEKIMSGLSSGRTIIVVGKMHAHYVGRSTSWLAEGDRLLIVKSDKSILIHRPTGYEPVNWQPPGVVINAQITEEGLVLECSRKSPPEILRIVITEVYSAESYRLVDNGEFIIHAREEDMKAAIINSPDIVEPGLRIIETERRIGEEYIDILAVDSAGQIVVIEIKRKRATRHDVEQIVNYATQLEKELGRKPRKILVAPSISKEAASLSMVLRVEYKCFSPRLAYEILSKKKGLDRFL
jgi:RecB family endonuclease NucS